MELVEFPILSLNLMAPDFRAEFDVSNRLMYIRFILDRSGVFSVLWQSQRYILLRVPSRLPDQLGYDDHAVREETHSSSWFLFDLGILYFQAATSNRIKTSTQYARKCTRSLVSFQSSHKSQALHEYLGSISAPYIRCR